MREREVWLLFQTSGGGERERCGCCFRLGEEMREREREREVWLLFQTREGDERERGVVVVSD